jgi:hypothetical protein
MALARDASSPALNVSGFLGATPESLASNSFSPPAGSVIVVTGYADGGGGTTNQIASASITDSLGSHLTWTQGVQILDTANRGAGAGGITVWWAFTSSAPGSMTATVTYTATGGQNIQGMDVAVDVYTGALTTGPIGATVTSATPTGTPLTVSITPTASGSALLIAAGDEASLNTLAASTGCFALATDNAPGGALDTIDAWLGTSSTVFTGSTSGSPTNLVLTGSAGTNWVYAAYEVLAAAAGSNSGPNYAGGGSALGGGVGSWVNIPNAEGAPDGAVATWTAP